MTVVRPDPTGRRRATRRWVRHAAPLVLACLLAFTLWVPGFHHHESDQAAAHCTLCLTAAVQPWDLPSATAAPPLPRSVDGRSVVTDAGPKPRAGVDHSQAPRGPPLT